MGQWSEQEVFPKKHKCQILMFKKGSVSLATREAKVKPTLRFHLTQWEWLPSRKQRTMVVKMWGKEPLFAASINWYSHTRNQCRGFSNKLKTEAIYGEATALLDIQERSYRVPRRRLHSRISHCTFHNIKEVRPASGKRKMWQMCTMEFYPATSKN